MKIAVILPRGMQFSPQGATSIDIVARDLILKSRFRDTTYVIGAATPDPFEDVDFRPVHATNQASLVREFLKQLHADLPDVVVVHQHPETAAKISKALAKTPVLLHRHGLLKESRGVISKWKKRRQFSPIAGIVFVSGFIRDRFLAQFPSFEDRATVVFNGVDTSVWAPARSKRQEIVYVGRARQDKGILPLIGAYQTLARQDWSLKLILGVQTEAETTFAKQIREACADLENIAIFQNEPSAAVQKHLSEASIAALPSIVREGFPRAVVEAMASGCAVIATHQGGTPEAAGDAALLLEEPGADDFETRLKDSLAELIDDSQRRDQLANAGRQRVVNTLGLEAVANRYDSLLEKLGGP